MKKLKLGRKKTIIASLIIGLILIGSSFSVWALSTNKGVIYAAPSSAPVHTPVITTLDGNYIYFQYKDSYKRDLEQPNNGSLESYTFTADTNYQKHLSVMVQRLDAANLSNFPSYTARLSQPKLYEKKIIMTSQGAANEFIKKDGTEKTIFALQGSNVAVFSFVTISQYDDVDSEIAAIMNSFRWK